MQTILGFNPCEGHPCEERWEHTRHPQEPLRKIPILSNTIEKAFNFTARGSMHEKHYRLPVGRPWESADLNGPGRQMSTRSKKKHCETVEL
jgi:hypothetical protein